MKLSMINETPKCPIMITSINTAPTAKYWWKECDHWSCKKCGNRRIETVISRLAEVTPNNDELFELKVDRAQVEAVRKKVYRVGLPSLRIYFNDGSMYIITDKFVKGSTWAMKEDDRIDIIAGMKTKIDIAAITDHRWTQHWEPPKREVQEKVHGTVISKVFGNFEAADAFYGEYGVNLETGYVPGAAHEIAEKINGDNTKSMKITFLGKGGSNA